MKLRQSEIARLTTEKSALEKRYVTIHPNAPSRPFQWMSDPAPILISTLASCYSFWQLFHFVLDSFIVLINWIYQYFNISVYFLFYFLIF